MNMRQAVILVGGRGTRLGDSAKATPKPLMPVAGDQRFLDILIENFARHGVRDLVLLAGHLGELVEARYDQRTIRDAKIRVIREPTPAGTAGALRYAADVLDDVFYLSNGDSFLDFNYLALGAALEGSDAGAIALRRVDDAGRYGRVDIDRGRVRGFHEKDTSYQGAAPISGGVYLLRRSILNLIDRTPLSIETNIFPALARAGALAGIEVNGYFIDIGLPETLEQARRELTARIRRAAVFFRDVPLFDTDTIDAIRAANDAGHFAFVLANDVEPSDTRARRDALNVNLTPHGAHIDAVYPGAIRLTSSVRLAQLEWPIASERSVILQGPGATTTDHLPLATSTLGSLPSVMSQKSLGTNTGLAAEGLFARANLARDWLFQSALPLWWNVGFDRDALCFHERLALDGSPVISLPRRIRVQARQTIVYARAGRLGWDGPWREAVDAGVDVLLTRGLRSDGGTRHMLDASGRPSDDRRDLYDLAFVLFALSEAAAVTNRSEALNAANDLREWLNTSWIHEAGGFLEGEITPAPPRRQNPHMHVFEALLSLYEVGGDAGALQDATKLARLFERAFFDPRQGVLREYYDDAWQPAPGTDGEIVEPGHEFEWSWLLHRWEALGGEGLGDIPERLRVHAECYGVDPQTGVTFDEILANGAPRARTSRFWPHTERIKANVARFERTRDPNAALAAAQAFDTLETYLRTPTRGVWSDRRNPDGSFVEEAAPASSFYHAMFAMSELIRIADEA